MQSLFVRDQVKKVNLHVVLLKLQISLFVLHYEVPVRSLLINEKHSLTSTPLPIVWHTSRFITLTNSQKFYVPYIGVFFRVSQKLRKWGKYIIFLICVSHFLQFKK